MEVEVIAQEDCDYGEYLAQNSAPSTDTESESDNESEDKSVEITADKLTEETGDVGTENSFRLMCRDAFRVTETVAIAEQEDDLSDISEEEDEDEEDHPAFTRVLLGVDVEDSDYCSSEMEDESKVDKSNATCADVVSDKDTTCISSQSLGVSPLLYRLIWPWEFHHSGGLNQPDADTDRKCQEFWTQALTHCALTSPPAATGQHSHDWWWEEEMPDGTLVTLAGTDYQWDLLL